MTKRSVFFVLLFSVYCLPVSVAQLYTDEVQVVSGLGGKVGIGTSTPSNRLHVKGAATFEGDGQGTDINFKNGGVFWHVSGPRSFESNRLGFFWFDGTAYHDYLTIGTNGGVGIGTSAPSRDLEIVSKPGAGAEIKVRQSAEQSGWGISFGQSTGLDGYIAAPGRNFTIHVGWDKVLTLGSAELTSYNGKVIIPGGNVGIGTTSPSQKLSVNGNASKATAGDWLANSDARLKTNISPLHSQETLQKMLQLQGITYEWSDDKTGLNRPKGIQYGFTAQNIQEVFPSLVVEDDKGYLQSSYSTYDAMLVESIRALNEKIERLERENSELRMEVSSLRSR